MNDISIYSNMPRIMQPALSPKAPASTPTAGGDSFTGVLKAAITQVSDLEKGSQGELQKFMNNESDLHSVMIALEKADLSFQTMMQVRNKIVSAYQEIMRTQV